MASYPAVPASFAVAVIGHRQVKFSTMALFMGLVAVVVPSVHSTTADADSRTESVINAVGVASDLWSSAASVIENVEISGEVVLHSNCMVPIPHRHMKIEFYRQNSEQKDVFAAYTLEGQTFRFIRKMPNGRYRVQLKHEVRDQVLTSKRVDIRGNSLALLLFVNCGGPSWN